jgi:hypothetical protein
MATRYLISDIENITFNGIQFQLPEDVINIVTNIANQVGAADYIRTPQFNKRTPNGVGVGSVGNGYAKKRNKNNEIQDDDWDTIRKFQATEIKKKDGIDVNIDSIRKHLNKITEKNYDKMFEQICQEFTDITDASQEDLDKIGDAIFTIASGNAFYSKTYAKLYNDLMNRYEFMGNIFKSNLNKFSELFTTIEYYNPNVDYDKFCDNNKTNDKRRALGTFYVNLMKENAIEKTQMIEIINNVQNYLMTKLQEEGNKEIIDELSENLFILITNSSEDLENQDEWENIIDNITTYSKSKVKDFPSATTKSIFKHMDILDEI